jgi:hypothetical protein
MGHEREGGNVNRVGQVMPAVAGVDIIVWKTALLQRGMEPYDELFVAECRRSYSHA